MARNRVKNKLVFNISCALLIVIASFLVIYLLAGRNSYSIQDIKTKRLIFLTYQLQV